MDSKFVIVTGANGGMGLASVNQLLNKGFEVIGIDISPLKNPSNSHYHFFQGDLTKNEEVSHLKNEISKLTRKVFAIVNLFGIFMMESIVEGSEEDFNKILNINFFALYHFNKTMFSFLEKGSRIVNISSEVAKYSTQPLMGYYSISKKMVDDYSDCLRRECAYIGIKVIKIQSGSISTNLLGGVDKTYNDLIENTVYFKKPLKTFKKLMTKETKKVHSPELIAKVVIKCVTLKKPKYCYRVKNSLGLKILGTLPEKVQDFIYLHLIG